MRNCEKLCFPFVGFCWLFADADGGQSTNKMQLTYSSERCFSVCVCLCSAMENRARVQMPNGGGVLLRGVASWHPVGWRLRYRVQFCVCTGISWGLRNWQIFMDKCSCQRKPKRSFDVVKVSSDLTVSKVSAQKQHKLVFVQTPSKSINIYPLT